MVIILSRCRTLACLAAVIVMCFAGCATMRQTAAPSVNLAGLRLVEVKGFETVLEVDLRVLNPDTTPLRIQGVDCDLTLNDRHLARGVANPQKEIPAYDSGIITFNVYASMLDVFGLAHRLLKETKRPAPDERWTYAIKGHLKINGDHWPGRLPFNTSGEIDLKKLLESGPAI